MIGPSSLIPLEATIKRYNSNNGTVVIGLNMSRSDSIGPKEYTVPIPASWMGPNGEFSGGFPETGSTVICEFSQGGQCVIVGFKPSDGVFGNKNTPSSSSQQNNQMAALRPGRHLIQVKNNIRSILDSDTGFQAGNPIHYIHADPSKKIYSNTFNEQLSFSEAHRKITGVVKRDLVSNSTRNVTGSALTSHIYNESLQPIGLDPLTKTGISFNRNPAFNESRTLVYEFAESYDFTTDAEEINLYDNQYKQPPLDPFFDRRESRADTLSLSLVAPNQLMESVSGTMVDIYGNLLDINRNVLPSGKIDLLSFRNAEVNQSATFTALREQARKTVAYHFEINARKPVVPDNNSYNTPTDYARDRSRFSFDIDKEGQFKLNIPASSEVGNIGLLTRNENYSTLESVANPDISPNQFLRNVDNQDIFQEQIGIGVVSLVGGTEALQSFAAPIDRITNEPIKLGMLYHNINDTLQLQNRVNPVPWYPQSPLNNQVATPLVGEIVNQRITVSGPNANAGGRSGTISLDGSLNLNIGANSSDRQSLWADLAGGMVMNVGRDLRNRSLLGRFDGDLYLMIGGATVANDSRFQNVNNANRSGVVDLRVVTGALMTVVRIDESGVTVSTPGSLDITSGGPLRLQSLQDDVFINGRSIYFYAGDDNAANARLVLRKGSTI